MNVLTTADAQRRPRSKGDVRSRLTMFRTLLPGPAPWERDPAFQDVLPSAVHTGFRRDGIAVLRGTVVRVLVETVRFGSPLSRLARRALQGARRPSGGNRRGPLGLRPPRGRRGPRPELVDACYPLPVHTDRDGLRIVLRNLLSNAVIFSEQRGAVCVRARATDDVTVLEVEAPGGGHRSDRLGDLFEAFEQGSTGPRRSYEGSGLGLAVTTRLVNRLDGLIEVDTEKGKRTGFRLEWPRATAWVPAASD